MEYAELHCKTNYSFLEGASHPEELVQEAYAQNYAALAITDRESLAGMVAAHVAAEKHGLKILVGAEMHPSDAPAVLLWAPDRKAYGRLCRLITKGRFNAEKGSCYLTFADIAEHAEGLLAGVLPEGDADSASIGRYRDLFGDRAYLMAELFRGPNDAERLSQLQELSRRSRVPLVAANDVRYHVSERLSLHDVLTAIRNGTTVDTTGEHLFPNAERHLRPIAEIAAVFAKEPDAVERTIEVASRCTFKLDELRYEYPEELVPAGETPAGYLARLTWEGAARRYPDGIPDKVRGLIEHELALISELNYEAYFLTVHDLVRYAESQHILCQGRGSAANSVVCYCLRVTSVNPDQIEMLFERFVSRERAEAPDIDIDFEHERREEVLQYLYGKYGRERTGLAATVITYCVRSAVRDVGKALGFSLDGVDALAKQVEGYHSDPKFGDRCAEVGIDPTSPLGAKLVELVDEIMGFPRHLSQHPGGMVMSRGPLCELVPIENAAMKDRTVVQWNKDDLDALGILKVDVLALGMLTAIRKCFEFVERHHSRIVTLATVPQGDKAVYDMISEADTVGVFQIESRAQMSMLPRLQPKDYYDLVIEVAIVRPGPIQGGMVHPYLQQRELRRENPNAPLICPPILNKVLERTFGVPLFQEQAMQIAMVAAGFTPGEADKLRRAMGAWRKRGIIEGFRDQFFEGMQRNNLGGEYAEQIFNMIRGFGEFGFPESHAASFALLVYVSSWLKCHYPAAFGAALLNSQPMGFYAPAQLVADARRHGVLVRPVDINHSAYDCTLEAAANGPALRLGFRLVDGMRKEAADGIVAVRADGLFQSIGQFARRTRLSRSELELLSDADAFGSLAINRRKALWQSLGQDPRPEKFSLFSNTECNDDAGNALPALSPFEEVLADYQASGMSLKGHPIAFVREFLDGLRVTQASELVRFRHRDPASVAGLVLVRQRPATASGITFVTLEDETGICNLIVHPKTWERNRRVARRSRVWIAHGVLERKDSVIHVIVHRLEDLSSKLEDVKTRSRDFR